MWKSGRDERDDLDFASFKEFRSLSAPLTRTEEAAPKP
jgi:hypothetical protein